LRSKQVPDNQSQFVPQMSPSISLKPASFRSSCLPGRDWFEVQTELNQKLEGVMAALWEEAVVRPLERMSDESAGELPEDIRSANVVPVARPVLA
jgi:hypothetical protein